MREHLLPSETVSGPNTADELSEVPWALGSLMKEGLLPLTPPIENPGALYPTKTVVKVIRPVPTARHP